MTELFQGLAPDVAPPAIPHRLRTGGKSRTFGISGSFGGQARTGSSFAGSGLAGSGGLGGGGGGS